MGQKPSNIYNMISIFIASRKSGNSNSNLFKLLQDIQDKTKKLGKIEVLIRIDNDDKNYEQDIQEFSKKMCFKIKTLQGEKLAGYLSLHIFYKELIPLADPKSKIFICFADDFLVEKNWDLMIHKVISKFIKPRYFIVHQKPHPPSNRPFADLFKFTRLPNEEVFEELDGVDEAPAWSASLIHAFKNFGPVAATDSWTVSLERRLQEKKLNITYFTKTPIIERVLDENIDSPKGERWHTQRKNIFSAMSSDSFDSEVSNSVEVVVNEINTDFFDNIISKTRYFLYSEFIEKIKSDFVMKNLRYLKYVSASATGSFSPAIVFQLKRHNIVAHQDYFYLIPQSSGEINFNCPDEIKQFRKSKSLLCLFLRKVM